MIYLRTVTTNDDASVMFGVSVKCVSDTRVRLFLVGIGWDDEQPWRPWPTFVRHDFRAEGHGQGWCFAWFGLFLNHRFALLTPTRKP